jgi:hypothetical protein
VTVSWFWPQNQVGFGLLVAPQNQRRELGAGHTLRSSGLLHVEGSLARVSQSDLKTGGGATVGGARGLLPPISPGLSRVCTILVLSRLSSPTQNLLRFWFQWPPAGPSGAQSSHQERAPAPLSVHDRQACLTKALMFLALRF